MSNILHLENDDLLLRLVERVPSMLASWGTDLRCRFANGHYEWWFGVERGSLIGTRLVDLIGPQAFALHEPHVRAVLAGQRRSFERIAQGPDGFDRHGWIEYIPDVVEGEVLGFFVQVTDITPIRQAEAALRSSEQHYRTLSESSPFGVFHAHGDGNLTYANERAQSIAGLTAEQALGAGWRAVIHPDDRLKVFGVVAQAVASQQEFDLECRLLRSDGEVRVVRTRVRRVAETRGPVGEFVGTIEDITEQQRRSDELMREQALREEVERQVLSADRLLHERGDMLNILAHEVRQPLNNASASLQSAASILSEFGERVASRRLVRAQVVLGEVLASIDNTLAAASLLARDDPIEREISEIDTLLDIAVADLLAGERGRVRIENPCGTRSTLMDLGLMRLAMRNLLSNALKFSGDDAPVILRVSESEHPPAMHIDVVDSGAGIASDRVQRLFERLSQDDPGRASLGRSPPLGLYIVRRVMELHGGRVELAANGPAGVTMRLVLPEPRDD